MTSARFAEWNGRGREGDGATESPWSEENRALVTAQSAIFVMLRLSIRTAKIPARSQKARPALRFPTPDRPNTISSNQIVFVRSDDQLLVADAHNVSANQRQLSFDPLAVDMSAGAVEVVEPDIVATIHHDAVTA